MRLSARDAAAVLALTCLLAGCGGQTLDLDSGGAPTSSGDAEAKLVVEDRAFQLVDAGKHLLWSVPGKGTASGQLWGCLKTDCPKSRSAYTEYEVFGVVASSSKVAFLGLHGINVCPSEGGGTTTPLYDPDAIPELSLDDDFVYWSSILDRSIYRCPLRGCGDTPERVVGGQSLDREAIQVADGQVYWWAGGKAWRTKTDGSGPVESAFSLAGSNQVTFSSDLYPVLQIVERTAYFVEATSHAVLRCELPDCANPVDVAITSAEKLELRAAGRDVFWLEKDHSLYSCRVDGCFEGPTLVTADPVFAYAVDEENVYWSRWREAGPKEIVIRLATGEFGQIHPGVRIAAR